MIEKHVLTPDRVHCNPFFISGTKVVEGDGEMMVLAVGVNSVYGKIKKKLEQA